MIKWFLTCRSIKLRLFWSNNGQFAAVYLEECLKCGFCSLNSGTSLLGIHQSGISHEISFGMSSAVNRKSWILLLRMHIGLRSLNLKVSYYVTLIRVLSLFTLSCSYFLKGPSIPHMCLINEPFWVEWERITLEHNRDGSMLSSVSYFSHWCKRFEYIN